MQFLIDANLPVWVARKFIEAGWTAQHVSDALYWSASDQEILQHAGAHDLVIVSKDQDFCDLIGTPPPQFLWLRSGNVSNRTLAALIDEKLGIALKDLSRGLPIVEI